MLAARACHTEPVTGMKSRPALPLAPGMLAACQSRSGSCPCHLHTVDKIITGSMGNTAQAVGAIAFVQVPLLLYRHSKAQSRGSPLL